MAKRVRQGGMRPPPPRPVPVPAPTSTAPVSVTHSPRGRGLSASSAGSASSASSSSAAMGGRPGNRPGKRSKKGAASRLESGVDESKLSIRELMQKKVPLSADPTARRQQKRARKDDSKKATKEAGGGAGDSSTSGPQAGAAGTATGSSSNVKDGEESEAAAKMTIAPQVKMVNGQIIVDKKSLTMISSEGLRNDTANYREVQETASFVTSASFSKRSKGDVWTVQDTAKFYDAVRQCGTDFTMICALLAGRTRRQIKNKFKKEDKEHPKLIEAALSNSVPIDLAHWEVLLGPLDPESRAKEKAAREKAAREKDAAAAEKAKELAKGALKSDEGKGQTTQSAVQLDEALDNIDDEKKGGKKIKAGGKRGGGSSSSKRAKSKPKVALV